MSGCSRLRVVAEPEFRWALMLIITWQLEFIDLSPWLRRWAREDSSRTDRELHAAARAARVGEKGSMRRTPPVQDSLMALR